MSSKLIIQLYSNQVRKGKKCVLSGSIADPDPQDKYVFRTPGSGSGSISQRYGSGSGAGSFYNQAKIVQQTLIHGIDSASLCSLAGRDDKQGYHTGARIVSACVCSLAGRYDNPIPARFLAPIDCLKISAREWPGYIGWWNRFLGSLKCTNSGSREGKFETLFAVVFLGALHFPTPSTFPTSLSLSWPFFSLWNIYSLPVLADRRRGGGWNKIS